MYVKKDKNIQDIHDVDGKGVKYYSLCKVCLYICVIMFYYVLLCVNMFYYIIILYCM